MAVDEDLECLRKISTVSSQSAASYRPKAAMLGSCRLNLALMCLVATLAFFLMRLNLSFALVCMVSEHSSQSPTEGNNTAPSGAASDSPLGDDIIGHSATERNGFRSNHTSDDLDEEDEEDQSGGDSTRAVHQQGRWEQRLDWDKETQGGLLGSFYYGFCVTQIFGGWLTDRVGCSKSILIFSMSAMSLLSFISPVVAVWNSQAFFALRLLLGLASGLALPTIPPLFARWSAPNERATLLGLAFAGFTLGSSITFPLSGLLCQYGFSGGWPSIFYLSGLLGIAWVLVAVFVIYDSPEIHPRISHDELLHLEPYCMKKQLGKRYNSIPWKAIFTSGPVNTINICSFCFNWGFYTLVSGLPMFLKEAMHFDITQNGLLSSMPYAAALIAHLVVGKFFDWCRRKEFYSLTITRKIFNTVGFLVPAISIFAVGQLTYQWRYVAVFLLALSQAAGELAIMGGFLLSNIDLAPQYSGVLQGIASTVGTIPGFISPLVMSYLTPQGTQREWAVVFYISAGFYLAGCVIYLIFGNSRRQSWAESTDIATGDHKTCLEASIKTTTLQTAD